MGSGWAEMAVGRRLVVHYPGRGKLGRESVGLIRLVDNRGKRGLLCCGQHSSVGGQVFIRRRELSAYFTHSSHSTPPSPVTLLLIPPSEILYSHREGPRLWRFTIMISVTGTNRYLGWWRGRLITLVEINPGIPSRNDTPLNIIM